MTQSARTIDFASPLRIAVSECCVSSVGSYSRLNCSLICAVCGPRNFCNKTEQGIYHLKRVRVAWDVNQLEFAGMFFEHNQEGLISCMRTEDRPLLLVLRTETPAFPSTVDVPLQKE